MVHTKSKVGQTDYVGTMKFRVFEINITEYNDTAGSAVAGDGEPWTPADAQMNRFVFVDAECIDGGDGYLVNYDYANNALHIYEAGADAAALDELGADATVDIDVRIVMFGH